MTPPARDKSWWLRAFDYVARAFRGRWGGRRALASFLLQGSSIGQYTNSWTQSRYEQVRHFRHWVYVAVDRIATEVAMHQPNVSLSSLGAYPHSESLRQRSLGPVPGWLRNKALTPLLSHEKLEVVPENHPLVRLLNDPNEPDTSFDLWYETTLYLLLTGNAYWWVPPNPLGKPSAVWVLPSHWVWASLGKERLIDSYEVRPVEGNYVRMSIPAEDVIHFKKKSPISKIDGYSPMQAMHHWVDTQESIDKTRWFSFRNGAFPGVAIGFDEKVQLPDDEDLDRIEAKFASRYAGEINYNKPIFIPPGANVKELSLSPKEMAYCESSEQLRDHILSTFGVPAVVAQVVKQMTYGSVLASQAGFYTGTINPLYRYFGQHVTEKLAKTRYDRRLKVWWEDRTPQDPELLEKSLRTDKELGAITPNEVRAIRGREPYPNGGDDPLVQGAMMTLPFTTGGDILSINSNAPPAPEPQGEDAPPPYQDGPSVRRIPLKDFYKSVNGNGRH